MRRLVLILGLALAWAGASMAQDRSSLWPQIPVATGTPHPEGNEYWRRNHMDLMRHDRDLTMREGNRQIGASLKGCFDCHAARDDTGQIVTYASDRHFCRACHDYAAVRVDCFMCHRSTPEGVDETAARAAVPTGRLGSTRQGSIVAYLGRTDPAASAEAGQ